MKKYFLNDGTGQQGPFDLDELRTKNISPSTPIWYEGLAAWTTAGQLAELNGLFETHGSATSAVEPATPSPVDEVTIPAVSADPLVIHDVTPVPVTASPATASATIAAAAASSKAKAAGTKKGSSAIAWISTVLLVGGVGFFIYQGIEKSNGNSSVVVDNIDTTKTIVKPVEMADNNNTAPDTMSNASSDTMNTSMGDDPAVTNTVTTTDQTNTTATTNVPGKNGTTATAQQVAAQQAAAKKAEEEKKKQAALKKAADDKKKADAAKAAQLARQLEMRQHWSKYITFGNLNYETKGDGIKAFDVPVYNGTDATLDKVTVRIEYLKKNEKKIVKTENITIYNVPPRGGLNGKAPESKKGEKVNVYFTSITSSGLHFCYPQNNGSSDPYFCN